MYKFTVKRRRGVGGLWVWWSSTEPPRCILKQAIYKYIFIWVVHWKHLVMNNLHVFLWLYSNLVILKTICVFVCAWVRLIKKITERKRQHGAGDRGEDVSLVSFFLVSIFRFYRSYHTELIRKYTEVAHNKCANKSLWITQKHKNLISLVFSLHRFRHRTQNTAVTDDAGKDDTDWSRSDILISVCAGMGLIKRDLSLKSCRGVALKWFV